MRNLSNSEVDKDFYLNLVTANEIKSLHTKKRLQKLTQSYLNL